MSRINACLKRIFIVFNVLLAIIGGVVIVLAMMSHTFTNLEREAHTEYQSLGLVALYISGSLLLVLSILGFYGAFKESRPVLIVFLVCMVVGSLMMFRGGFQIASVRPQIEGALKEVFKHQIPLDNSNEEMKHLMNSVQSQYHCCGMFRHQDWEKIPDSCKCSPTVEDECREVDYTALMQRSIYSQPCFPIIIRYILIAFDYALGFFFVLAGLAVLGLIMSSIMVHQLRYRPNPAVPLTAPFTFSSAPPKYQELYRPSPPLD